MYQIYLILPVITEIHFKKFRYVLIHKGLLLCQKKITKPDEEYLLYLHY